ncbi:MAG: Glycosyl hydrolase, BNR repeat precursor [Candidatus Kapaibacterium sp.]|nr:MAG: Glycosyl hydrolase, BNR repeat precursor [Candidatus Kapabacteria bacterium]
MFRILLKSLPTTNFLVVILTIVFQLSLAKAQWIQTNGPYGGIVKCISVSGPYIVAGTAGNGIFLSTNDGENWEGIKFSDYSILCMTIKDSTIFVGTQFDAIYISTNWGKEWKKVDKGLKTGLILSLATLGQYVFAGTGGGGIYISSNNGESWVETNLKSASVTSLKAIGSNLFAGTWERGFLLSTDLGETWRTLDRGISKTLVWSIINVGNRIFAGSNDGVFVSTDNGESWRQVNNGLTDTRVLSLEYFGQYLLAGTLGGVFISTDFGESWRQINNGLGNLRVWSVAVRGTKIFAGTEYGIYCSTNNGENWLPVGLPALNALSIAIKEKNLFSVAGGNLYVSKDLGKSWKKLSIGFPNLNCTVVAVHDSSIYLGTERSGIFVSTDNGESWKEINNGFPKKYCSSFAFIYANIFVGTYGGIWRSTDNGESWWPVNYGLNYTRVYSLAVKDTILFAGTETGAVYRSTNLGESWEQVKNGFTSDNAYAVAVVGNTIVGGGIGIFFSTDNGETWLKSDLVNVKISSIFTQDNMVFAGTEKNGVYMSVSKGSTWFPINDGLKNLYVQSLSILDSMLFAGTFGNSVFKRPLSELKFPPPPKLASPPNGTYGVPYYTTLCWYSVDSSSSYRLQVSTNKSFQTTILDTSGLKDTSFAIDFLEPNFVYYWRVNAKKGDFISDWSEVWSFETILTPPKPPKLVSPQNNVWTVPTVGAKFIWNSSRGATSYRLQISTTPDFSTIVFDKSDIKDTFQVASEFSNGVVYYWRVNASNSAGTGDWSEVWRFKAIWYQPKPPKLVSPPNNSENVATIDAKFVWNSSQYATSYRLQISLVPDFSTTVFDKSGITDTFQIVSELLEGVVYFWRVNASNSGGTSDWSEVWSFKAIIFPPDAPILVSPPNGATVDPNEITLVWRLNKRALTYRVQVSTSKIFLKKEFEKTDLTDTSVTISGLAENKTYYWRVDATNSTNTGPWSEVWSFTISGLSSKQETEPQETEGKGILSVRPNPFVNSTTIEFKLPKPSFVTIKVYNALGTEVATLLSQNLPSGHHEVNWKPTGLPSGVYFIRLQADGYVQQIKILVLK